VAENTETHHDDEIDLVELIVNLWNEKILIIITTGITTVLGLGYAMLSTPVYTSSVQLLKPSPAELSYLNQTPYYEIEPTEVFTEFLSTLSSFSHLNSIAINSSDLLSNATGLEINESIITKLGEIRTIDYPNTKKKSNEIAPDQYFLTYEGINRSNMKNLILNDLKEANNTTIQEINQRYKNQLQLKIQELSWKQELDLEKLKDQLTSRKNYVMASRKDKLIQLEEALKIAKILKIERPTSLAKLAKSQISKQVEITAELNNNQDPLYLRGTRLLSAEIDSLKNLSDTVFLDNEIRQLNANKIVIENNRELIQLKNILNLVDNHPSTIKLNSPLVNTPPTPIKPRKTLIVAISLLLGGMLGIFFAIARIVYKNYQTAHSSED
jgi:LPS O-antigen subunit length determinant protein (WzzB/FepE family)